MATTEQDHALAVRIADEAGGLLLELRSAAFAAGVEDPKALGKAGDRQAHELIVARLAELAPAGDIVLSEEEKDDPVRLGAKRVWIVDPLDGTREYGEEGRTDWAVHVALVVDGVPTAAAVAIPARGITLATAPGAHPPIPKARSGAPVLVVSRTRPPAVTESVRAALGAELLPMGSAGVKAMSVLLGDADAYVHAGGQWEWDSAAPVGVALAAGLHVSRIDGSPLVYNQDPPYLPDLIVCRPELSDHIIAAARPE